MLGNGELPLRFAKFQVLRMIPDPSCLQCCNEPTLELDEPTSAAIPRLNLETRVVSVAIIIPILLCNCYSRGYHCNSLAQHVAMSFSCSSTILMRHQRIICNMLRDSADQLARSGCFWLRVLVHVRRHEKNRFKKEEMVERVPTSCGFSLNALDHTFSV